MNGQFHNISVIDYLSEGIVLYHLRVIPILRDSFVQYIFVTRVIFSAIPTHFKINNDKCINLSFFHHEHRYIGIRFKN
jgi:hypothetical protein